MRPAHRDPGRVRSQDNSTTIRRDPRGYGAIWGAESWWSCPGSVSGGGTNGVGLRLRRPRAHPAWPRALHERADGHLPRPRPDGFPRECPMPARSAQDTSHRPEDGRERTSQAPCARSPWVRRPGRWRGVWRRVAVHCGAGGAHPPPRAVAEVVPGVPGGAGLAMPGRARAPVRRGRRAPLVAERPGDRPGPSALATTRSARRSPTAPCIATPGARRPTVPGPPARWLLSGSSRRGGSSRIGFFPEFRPKEPEPRPLQRASWRTRSSRPWRPNWTP
jgi:hypothetical protein